MLISNFILNICLLALGANTVSAVYYCSNSGVRSYLSLSFSSLAVLSCFLSHPSLYLLTLMCTFFFSSF